MAKAIIRIDRKTHSALTTMGTLGISWPFGGGTNKPNLCHTLEHPWKGNAKDKSCIPPGRYPAHTRSDGHLGWRIELEGTGPRVHVEIHRGNDVKDTIGCVVVGMRGSKDYVHESQKALDLIHSELAKAKGKVEISVEIYDSSFKKIAAEWPSRGTSN